MTAPRKYVPTGWGHEVNTVRDDRKGVHYATCTCGWARGNPSWRAIQSIADAHARTHVNEEGAAR